MRPTNYDDPLYQLLRDGEVKAFNERRASGEACDLTDCDLRSLDLRNLDLRGLDLTGAYLRQCDLRGLDFTGVHLMGASINGAKISGCLFPPELEADEIVMSLLHGTRMRYRP
jgi:uncharacterized protein YjbI with pentapeptide repeats